MYCKNCGNEIPNGAEICNYCGCSQTNTNVYIKNDEGIKCPYCGSGGCAPVTESVTSGSDFSAGKGICGYVLLGPIGILCGACGNGKTTKTNTYWKCPSCGKRFH